MATCRMCRVGGLEWKKIDNKWRLFEGGIMGGRKRIHECPKDLPEKPVDKDLESRRLKLIGFRFNNTNLGDGLLEAILKDKVEQYESNDDSI